MNTAIIAEYDPFHNGHAFHIEKTRELTGCENIIIVMSGNFVQRGEPAVFDKFVRTRQALKNGADMVLELPVEYATGAADIFAGKAAEMIEKSGIVSALSFGSESGEISKLDRVAEVFVNESAEFKDILKKKLAEGASYPAARAAAAEQTASCGDILKMPNNILAIEYLAALKKLNSAVKPYTVKRTNNYSSAELSGKISSASAVRRALAEGIIPYDAIPENTAGDYKNAVFPNIDGYSAILAYILRTAPPEKLAKTADITEGLENRLYTLSAGKTVSELVLAAKTSRYTYTKLQRAVLHMILGITKQMQSGPLRYIRVLGVRAEKKYLINELTKKSSLPVITRVKPNEELLENEIRATDIYNILTGGKIGSEYKTGMTVL